jgi:hypothetical protein
MSQELRPSQQPSTRRASCLVCRGEGRIYEAITFDELTGLWCERAYPGSQAPPGQETRPCDRCRGRGDRPRE